MKNRTRKRQLDWRCKLARQFVKDTLRTLAEAKAEKLTACNYGPLEMTAEERAWDSMAPTGREFGSPDYIRLTQLDNQAIWDRCAALGLSIEHAQRLAAAANPTDPQSLLRVLGLDIATLAPLKSRRWLWMVAQSSSVSYRRILTPETLLEIFTTGDVPPEFLSHVLHLLDEVSIQCVVMAVEQAAQKSGIPIKVLWRNVERISEETQSCRNGTWTTSSNN